MPSRVPGRVVRRLRGDRGATAVEFAIVLPIALLLIATVLLFALRMTYAALADHAARVGLKKATIRTSQGYPSDAAVRTTVDGLFAADLLGTPTSFTVTRTLLADSRPGQGDPIRVQVAYTVPGFSAASVLVPELGPFKGLRASLQDLGTVTRTADGRSE